MLLDHIVIHVNDLEAASADYRSLGFTVTPGGEHADGSSHNALISFTDGAYLELIAFKRPPPPEHLFARGVAQGEGIGIIAYALLPDDIEADVAAAKQRGLDLAGPFPGGRLRPDGVRLEWQTARATTPDLPFLCVDVTPRELRVPGGDATSHANGVQMIAGIVVVVTDLEVSTARYKALLGGEPFINPTHLAPRTAVFWPWAWGTKTFGRTTIILMEPGEGEAFHHLKQRGEVHYYVTLQGPGSQGGTTLDPALTHGANIELSYL